MYAHRHAQSMCASRATGSCAQDRWRRWRSPLFGAVVAGFAGLAGLEGPAGLVAGLLGEADVDVFVELDLAVEDAALDHEVAHQVEVGLAGGERVVHDAVD